jgi:ATP phosphoribosyltransferase regulatory subunit
LYTKNLPELLSLAARLGVNDRDTEILKLFLTPIKFFDFGSFRNKLLNLLTLEEKTKSETILNEILNFSQKLKKPNINYIWDPSLLRDVSYYTGIQFQGYMLGNPEPVFAGGVYDHLYETFSGISKPSSGFAIHLDPIEELINKQK